MKIEELFKAWLDLVDARCYEIIWLKDHEIQKKFYLSSDYLIISDLFDNILKDFKNCKVSSFYKVSDIISIGVVGYEK